MSVTRTLSRAYLARSMTEAHSNDAITDALIESAIDIVALNGMEGLTVKAVTSRVGISLGAFYHHFTSKDGLIDAVVAHLAESTSGAVELLKAGRLTMAETISAFVSVTLAACRDQPGRAAFLSTAIRSGRWGAESMGAVKAAVELAGRTDSFSAKYPGLVERLLCSMIQGAYDFLADHPEAAADPDFEAELIDFAQRLVACEA